MRKALLFILALSLAAFILFSRNPGFYDTPPNVILIVIDALRPDHLGCYGYYRDTSPSLDRLSRESAVFENVVAQSSWTSPSVASIMTALYPAVHGLTSEHHVLDPSHVTLAEVLKGAGYVTCGFVEAPFLTADMGFGRGFDSFTRLPYKKGKQTPQTWLQWIKKNQRNKFFLFIHTYNVHQAYSSPAPYNTLYDPGYSGTITGRVKPLVNNDSLKAGYAQDPELSKNDLRHLIALYDGGIRYNDVIMESLIAELQRLGLYDRSLIVITADHGDAFYEHKIFGHYKLLYNEVLKVPLIIKFPHGHFHNRRVACQVRSIDIMPTILEVVGTAARGNLQGEGLLNLLAAADSPGACDRIAFSDVHIDHRRGKRILAVQTGHYKYIRLDNSSDPAPGSVQEELYDVRTDPGETHNLIPGERAIRDFMKSMVEEYMEQERAHAPSAWGPAYDKAAVEQLRDLGYMQ